ncbi:MAG: hypothetical protein SFV24_15000 [Gemmatimonadales bacterium]|nr:hypothetical protein [Gemmatimonadales bacterium]
MPFLINITTPVLCPHGGTAHLLPNPRLLLSGAPMAAPNPAPIVGCAMPPAFPVAGPAGPAKVMAGAAHRFQMVRPPAPMVGCVLATFVTNAVRIRSNGLPVPLASSVVLTSPGNQPMTIMPNLPRVKGL